MVEYGRCIGVTDDLPARWKYITGARAVGEAVYRRWSTERGELPYDLDYGTDARDLIGETVRPGWDAEWAAALSLEAKKDERVEACDVSITYDASSSTAIITAVLTLSEGPTFRLVVAVTELTVALLRVG